MAKKSKSKQKLKSVMFTFILAVIVVAVFTYLIMNEGNIMPKDKGEIAATVNGEEITLEELDLEYARLPEQYKSLLSKEDILSQLIDKKLLFQEAAALGITVSDSEIEEQLNTVKGQFPTEEVFIQLLEQQELTSDDIKNQIKDQLIINKLLNQTALSKIEISEQEIADYYKENLEQFIAGEGQIRAAHILVDSEDEADEIIRLLEKGADFQGLALEKSQDPSVSVNKGDLGFFSKGTMAAEFEKAAFSLKIGEISDPVKTQFGYHIIRRLSGRISINEAKGSISSIILRTKQSDVVGEFLEELREKADIQKGEQIELELKNNFKATQDEICIENGKPIIRRYTASTCTKCKEVEPSFKMAVADYKVIVKEWELDTGDNLNTEIVETALPESEYKILKKYNPKGAVPAYVFGCKYVRIGDAFSELNLIEEENAFREILQELIG